MNKVLLYISMGFLGYFLAQRYNIDVDVNQIQYYLNLTYKVLSITFAVLGFLLGCYAVKVLFKLDFNQPVIPVIAPYMFISFILVGLSLLCSYFIQ
ncbi:hypothetical protein [Phocoenobacter skyensis]|uniref:hypothetical protein n=1 Tax=Phocoenobacter skyensis TaxID=97481 RepID=UPI00276EBD25|nr:hypothetical protein [Pasteurella skyensis]MDP8185296.1 hypothetical protein [Pasteurella skyensis]